MRCPEGLQILCVFWRGGRDDRVEAGEFGSLDGCGRTAVRRVSLIPNLLTELADGAGSTDDNNWRIAIFASCSGIDGCVEA
jgi:hypothetical protein